MSPPPPGIQTATIPATSFDEQSGFIISQVTLGLPGSYSIHHWIIVPERDTNYSEMGLQHLPRYPIFFAPFSLTVLACVILLFISFNGGMYSPGEPEHCTSSFKFGIWEKQSPGYCISQHSANYPSQETSTEGKYTVNRSSTLSIASQIFVVSLPRRTQIEVLRCITFPSWQASARRRESEGGGFEVQINWRRPWATKSRR